jgi:hypothetical protein
MDIVESYATKIREHIMDDESDALGVSGRVPIHAWLPQCERQIRKCLGLLSALGLSEACTAGLVDLSADFQQHTVEKVFAEATAETKLLQLVEDWDPSTDGLHTSLPDRFGSVVCRAILSVAELCSAPTNPASFIFESDEEGEELMCSVLSAFTTVLERLAYETGARQPSESPTRSRGKSGVRRRDVAPAEKRWMLVMSNCLYVLLSVPFSFFLLFFWLWGRLASLSMFLKRGTFGGFGQQRSLPVIVQRTPSHTPCATLGTRERPSSRWWRGNSKDSGWGHLTCPLTTRSASWRTWTFGVWSLS